MGWTWEYVWETLDVDRLNALEKNWGGEPLTEQLVAAFVGWKPKEKAGSAKDLLDMFPQGTISG